MSKLLEKAIIDAKALKEAALKNAEQLVIEKYSQEVKTAVNRLLNEEPEVAGADLSPEDLGMQDTGSLFDTDPAETPENNQEEPKLDPESLTGTLPDAFSTEDEDELITIKLDSLEAEYEEEEDGPFAGDDEFSDDEIGIDILSDEDLELDFDSEEDDEDFELEDDEIGVDITDDIVQEVLDEMGLNEEDIDIEDLVEKVRVDFEPQKSGWAGTPESQMREYESMLLAKEQDTETKEENAELRKAVADLQKENKTLGSAASKLQAQNKTLTSAAKKLQLQNEKYETAFDTLQEKLETMNVSNAKLLYINQALENASLNERQKRKIVEAISKAETVQEAKIVFDTMSDTVQITLDAKRDVSLNEMVSRKSSLLVAARKEQPNKDANPLYNRMQKLAGIKTQKS